MRVCARKSERMKANKQAYKQALSMGRPARQATGHDSSETTATAIVEVQATATVRERMQLMIRTFVDGKPKWRLGKIEQVLSGGQSVVQFRSHCAPTMETFNLGPDNKGDGSESSHVWFEIVSKEQEYQRNQAEYKRRGDLFDRA